MSLFDPEHLPRLDIEVPPDVLTVTDLKNHAHCPRFAWYEHCLPDVRPRTFNMDAGKSAHERERERARRRSLSAYGLPDGERRFGLRLYAPALGLTGELDELVIAPGEVYFPVDYKLSTRVSPSFEVQIAAYALLVEHQFSVVVPAGYIYLIGPRSLHRIDITPARRAGIADRAAEVRRIRDREQMPDAPSSRAICRDCEFRRFCNDV